MAYKNKKILVNAVLLLLAALLGKLSLLFTVTVMLAIYEAVHNVTGGGLSARETGTVLLGALVLNVLLVFYLKFQKFIPYWDYAGYYIECLEGAKLYENGIVSFLKEVYASMCRDDYTKLPVLFVAPFLKLFGGSYNAYITIIYNIFIVPFYLTISVAVKKIDKRCLPLVFLFTPFLTPMLRGYLDGMGLIIVAAWICAIIGGRLERLDIKTDILLAVLSCFLLFTRRWYLFFIVSLAAALFITSVLKKIFCRDYKIKNLIYNGIIIALSMLLILLVFFFPYVMRVLGNRFSDTYSAYSFGGVWWNIKYFMKYYGVIVCAFAALGTIAGICDKKHRWFTVFLTLQLIIMFFMFIRIQTISYHHQYIFATGMFMLIAIGSASLKKYKKLWFSLAACIIMLSFIYVYVPFDGQNTLETIGFTAKRFPPKVNNTEGAKKLANRLNELCKENEYAYILASSEIINDEMIDNSALPQKRHAVNRLFGTSDVDKRDGFPNSLLVAKYVVVAEPCQIHLGQYDQRVVGYFVDEILSGNVKNLRKIETMSFSDGVILHIYERMHGYSAEFLDKTQSYFKAEYPGYPELYNIDKIYSQN